MENKNESNLELAKNLLETLKDLSTNEIQQVLLNTKTSITILVSLAQLLNIEHSSHDREDLVDRIVKVGFANPRGYSILRNL